MLTKAAAEALVAEHGSIKGACRVLRMSPKTIRKALKSDGQEVKVAPARGGFDLKGRTLMAKKPTDVYGPRFNALRLETGYLPEVLSAQWGCSVNTVRDRARALGAIRYTEQDGQYIEVIVNPKTRGGK
jgi:hypothetical protein